MHRPISSVLLLLVCATLPWASADAAVKKAVKPRGKAKSTSPKHSASQALSTLDKKEFLASKIKGKDFTIKSPTVLSIRQSFRDAVTYFYVEAPGGVTTTPTYGKDGMIHLHDEYKVVGGKDTNFVGLRFRAAPDVAYLVDCTTTLSRLDPRKNAASDIHVITDACRPAPGGGTAGACGADPAKLSGSATTQWYHLLRFVPATSQPREIEARVVATDGALDVYRCEISPLQ
jgi:hypothetical protein